MTSERPSHQAEDPDESSSSAPGGKPQAKSTPAWEKRYSRKILTTDIAIVITSVFFSQWLRYGSLLTELQVSRSDRNAFDIYYTEISIAIIIVWLIALAVSGSRAPQAFGTGPTEYKRVINSTFFIFGGFAIIAYLVQAPIARGYLSFALPIGLVLLLLSRWLWRKRLHRQRKRGKNVYRTLVLGERSKSEHVAQQIMRSHFNGLWIVGAITEHGSRLNLIRDVEVVGGYDDILDAIDQTDADTLVLTSSDALSPTHIRQLGWELESRNVNLIAAASLTDIAGPRIHMRPVQGLPLMHIDYPRFQGWRRVTKRFFDLTVSSIALIVFSPLFIVLAALIKRDSKGPVLFMQERIGLDGRPFRMFKFRSMVADAENYLPNLLNQSEGSGVLFKIREDPRITRLGRLIRKYSLDELPQLGNVFLGHMSLVGPRPPLPSEVNQYDEWTERRLLVPPGITGLWQVSGRSDLSWEDSVRLDLYYVENWSLVGDVMILLRTFRAVLKPVGAY